MIRLLVADDNGVQHELDTYGNESIPITLSVDDLNNFEGKVGSYSKDFDLPATKNNNIFFENLKDAQSKKNFSTTLGHEAVLYIDGILVFEGILYLLEVVSKSKETKYKVNLLSFSIQMLETLGDATLCDLDFSDLHHNFTGANVTNSQTATGVTLAAGGTSTDIYYSLINNTQVWLSGGEMDINAARSYQPFVSLKSIVDKIFNYAGVQYISDFFNSTYFKSIFMDTGTNNFVVGGSYLTAWARDNSSAGTFTHQTVKKPFGDDWDIHYTQEITTSYVNVSFSEELVDGSNIMALGVITAPTDNFVFNLDVTVPIWSVAWKEITIIARINSGGNVTDTVLDTITPASFAPESLIFGDGEMYRSLGFDGVLEIPNSGGTLSIMIKGDAPSVDISPLNDKAYISRYSWDMDYTEGGGGLTAGGYVPYEDYSGGEHEDFYPNMSVSYVSQVIATPLYSDDVITEKVCSNHGDVKLVDIIKDLSTMFNLIIEPQDGGLKIEPYSEFVNHPSPTSGVDWTHKIDETEVVQNYEDMPSQITWRYNNDEDDVMLNRYQSATGQEYGAFVLETTADYTDEKEIKLEVFSATAYQVMSNGVMFSTIVSHEEDDGWQPLENAPRLIFKPTTNVVIPVNDRFDVTDDTSYSAGGHFEDLPSMLTSSSNDLNFGYTLNQLISGTYTQPINNLYNKYWRDYVLERYSEDRVLVKAKVYLTPSDILDFSFAKDVMIKNQRYRVNKIEYNAGTKGLAKVELLKLL